MGATDLLKVSANGGDAQVTTERAEGEIDHGHIGGFLPAGELVTFGVTTASWDDAAILVHSLSDGSIKKIIDGGEQGFVTASGHLVYARAGNLLAVRVNLQTLETTGRPVEVLGGVLHPLEGIAPQFSLSLSGTLAYIPAAEGGRLRQLLWIDRSGEEEVIPLPPRPYFDLALAPDGKQLAASVTYADSNMDVRVYAINRGTLIRRLTSDPSQERSPVWSPDMKRVYYRVFGRPETRWKSLEGVDEGVLTNEFMVPLNVSADGETFVFLEVTPATGHDVALVTTGETPTSRALLSSPFAENGATISPDDRFLAYASTESGRWEVYVSPFPDVETNRWQVSSEGGVYPAWSPDGDELFYVHGRSMVSVDIDAREPFQWGEPEVLFEGDYAGRTISGARTRYRPMASAS